MIQENEIVMLFISGGVLIPISKYRSPLRRLPASKLLLSSGYSLDGKATEILNRGGDGFIQKPMI